MYVTYFFKQSKNGTYRMLSEVKIAFIYFSLIHIMSETLT